MAEKVKRGLGLLAVAALALLVGVATYQNDAAPAQMVGAVAGAVFVASLAVGLVLIAWGLLRD